MEANRKLDALVHEHILLKRVSWKDGYPYDAEAETEWHHQSDELRRDFGMNLGREVTPEGDIPTYSTDIRAAYAMEEALAKRDRRLIEKYAFRLLNEIGYASSFDTPISEWDVWLVAHATPEQRCIAALLALGVELDLEHYRFKSEFT